VKFWFNGWISRTYGLRKGVLQGSPHKSFLFGVNVADEFRPRLRYGPALRSVVVSYVDNRVIMGAGDTREMGVGWLEELFCDCVAVANGPGIGFSVLKTEWTGFRQGILHQVLVYDVT